MKNINKTTKTILFASLIAAMILPFSFIDVSAAIQNAEPEGKLFVKDNNDLKNLTKEDFAQLEANYKPMSQAKTDEVKAQIDKIADEINNLDSVDDIWITSIGTDYETGNVKVSIERSGLTESNIPQIEKQIRKIIGDKADITISYSDPLLLACSQTGDCNPIQGGTRIGVGAELCSMGYKAFYSGQSGFVTAGHCNSGATGTPVGNPMWWDTLGTVTFNAFNATGTWCDCAFVENTAETTSSDVFNGQNISGFLFPTMFDWLDMEGTVTQGVQGGITDTYEHINPSFCLGCPTVWIYGVVETTALTQGGDSGGSVIENTAGTPKFAGTIITDAGHYTPYYRITNAFPGITLG